MKTVENLTLDSERALYASRDIELRFCRFDGEADGESALKESENVIAKNCFFNLRYPFWHVKGLSISKCEMTQKCRAPIWYSSSIKISNTEINGTKALRECNGIEIKNCTVVSNEFGWSCKNIKAESTDFSGEYFMLRAQNLECRNITLTGKYSYQYLKNAVFESCTFNTKDAFWHASNVTLRSCTVRGEYLGWYSENLTLENCTLIGTQPLCYCKGLVLKNCKMLEADLSFEKSEVYAELSAPIVSIKNPASGRISVPSYGELIITDKNDTEIITEKALC